MKVKVERSSFCSFLGRHVNNNKHTDRSTNRRG